MKYAILVLLVSTLSGSLQAQLWTESMVISYQAQQGRTITVPPSYVACTPAPVVYAPAPVYVDPYPVYTSVSFGFSGVWYDGHYGHYSYHGGHHSGGHH